MSPRFLMSALRWLLAMLLALSAGGALAQSEQQKLVNAADTTFLNFMRDPQMTWLQQNIGRAVLVVRDAKSGKWVGPAFYTLATASVGFQAGVAVSEMLTLVMTEKALNSLLSDSVKLGPDASVAAGPVGAGAKADVVTDLVSYSRSKGIYGGINLDGTVVAVSKDWNQGFYQKPVSAPDILVRMTTHNKSADKLIGDVSRATGRR
ncbi:MAG: lipid-binding SYLF domain-containing protein [Betaproteobacteria bacterium]|nr:MAG: lipid-binding SYLF domain-containing protein [Betaproteobacteria bacterium]